jgi:hypothetical protein
VLMGTPQHRRGFARLNAGAERSLLMRLLRELPGVDVRIVADPTLRSAATVDQQAAHGEGVQGPDAERVEADA